MPGYEEILSKIDWKKINGLVPVIAQDIKSKEVLMLAYMDKQALKETLESGYAHYYSRQRKKIWMKGETSGNTQRVKEILIDCDNDALLLKVKQKGNACHTGNKTCFYTKLCDLSNSNVDEQESYADYLSVLKELEDIIKARKQNPRRGSYTSLLFKQGKERIYKKFGEEAIEVIVARNKQEIVEEVADLLYHLFVLLSYNDIEFKEVLQCLKRRMNKQNKVSVDE